MSDHGTELYSGPLDGFVRARTELSRRLRAAGDREGAAAVAGLRKPSLGAWVVDQLARREPGLVRDLLAAAADAREAQRPGGSEALREASGRLRSLVDDIGRAARGILEEGGHPVSDATLRRAQTTAQAAAAGTPAEREALLHGTLDHDLDPPGFGPAGEAEPDTAVVAEAIRDRRHPAPGAAGARRNTPSAAGPGEVEGLAQAARRAEREAVERRREADRAAASASRQRSRADRLAAEARAAGEEAEAAERTAASAGEAALAAEADLVRARRALDSAHPS